MKTLLWTLAAVVVVGGAAYLVLTQHGNGAMGGTASTTIIDLTGSTMTSTTSTSTYYVMQGRSGTSQFSSNGGSGGQISSDSSSSSAAGPINGCDYVTSADIVSVFGSTATDMTSPSDECIIVQNKDDDVALVDIIYSGQNPSSLVDLVKETGGQPVQGIGDSAFEIQESNSASIALTKGNYSALVSVQGLQSNSALAVQFAKLVAANL